MLLTTDQAAREVGVEPNTMRIWCRKGKIKAQKYGRDWLITMEALAGVDRSTKGWPAGKKRKAA